MGSSLTDLISKYIGHENPDLQSYISGVFQSMSSAAVAAPGRAHAGITAGERKEVRIAIAQMNIHTQAKDGKEIADTLRGMDWLKWARRLRMGRASDADAPPSSSSLSRRAADSPASTRHARDEHHAIECECDTADAFGRANLGDLRFKRRCALHSDQSRHSQYLLASLHAGYEHQQLPDRG